jgi:hypothetical protein
MNRRIVFLTGCLSGLLIGAALMWISLVNTPARDSTVYTLPRNPVVLPVGRQGLPQTPNSRQLPEGWELRQFNGQPYYIVPLKMSDRRAS